MRITLLLNHDPASAYALGLLAPKLSLHQLTVFYTNKPSGLKPLPSMLAGLALFEKTQFTKLNKSFLDFKAQRLNHVNDDGFERFRQSQPELAISIRHMSILKPKSIAIPEHGVINLHSGLLPKYQGVMATFWAMKNQEARIGTTLHYIEDSTIDTGSIISQSDTRTDFRKSYFWNLMNIYQSGCENILQAVNSINHSGTVNAKPQSGTANYFSYPNDEQLDSFKPSLFEKHDSNDFLA